MKRAFALMKLLVRHVGFGGGMVFSRLAALLASQQEPNLSQEEIAHRFAMVLECGF